MAIGGYEAGWRGGVIGGKAGGARKTEASVLRAGRFGVVVPGEGFQAKPVCQFRLPFQLLEMKMKCPECPQYDFSSHQDFHYHLLRFHRKGGGGVSESLLSM